MEQYFEQGARLYGLHLQYADHSRCIRTATLPIGVKDGGKEEKKKKRKAVPRAAAA